MDDRRRTLEHTRLERAFRDTVFRAFSGTEVVEFRIDEPPGLIHAVLRQHSADSAAFITAYNPRGVARPSAENERAQARLLAEIDSLGLPRLDGDGADPSGQWPPEPSVLVLGIDEARATELAARYEQAAYVYIEMGTPARLVWSLDEFKPVQRGG